MSTAALTATRRKQESCDSITISSPAAGYIAVKRGEQEPELIRFGYKPRGAVPARGVHGPASSPSDGVGAGGAMNSMERKRVVRRDEQPTWTRRGLFRNGVCLGQPTLRGAKLFTKGKG